MIEQQQRDTLIGALNKTALSQHITSLFRQEKAALEAGLVLGSLIMWAQKSLDELDYHWMERVAGWVAMQEMQGNPQSLYADLAVPGMEEAQTLQEAAMLALSNLADIIIPDHCPAAAYR